MAGSLHRLAEQKRPPSTMKVDICAYDAPDGVGGPLVWVQRLPLALRNLGFDVRVNLFAWQTPEHGYAYRTLQQQGIPVQTTLFNDTERNVRWLLKLAEARRPDVFVANHVIPAFYAAGYLKEAGIPTVGILRSDDPFYHAIAERFVYSKNPWQLSAVVCVSEYLRAMVVERSNASLLACRIPSGVPVPERETQPPTDILRVAYVGRMVEEQKQVSALSRALLRVTAEVEGVEAALYGSGPASEAVKRIIANSHSAKIQYRGELASVGIQERLLETHVIVLLSDYEGTPMAVMEAMACGCVPVCLSTRSGIPELVKHGVTGLLVENRGEPFVSAIRLLKENPQLWRQLSNNARSHIENQYSITKCAADWSDLLKTVQQNVVTTKTFSCPGRIRLPATHADFAHQDWRKPTALMLLLSDIAHKYSRTRILAGRVRRRLLGQPVP